MRPSRNAAPSCNRKRGEGYDAEVREILAQIDEAASTLLVPEFKHGYDRRLGLHLINKRNSRRRALSHASLDGKQDRPYLWRRKWPDLRSRWDHSIIFVAIAIMVASGFWLSTDTVKFDVLSPLTWMEQAAVPQKIDRHPSPPPSALAVKQYPSPGSLAPKQTPTQRVQRITLTPGRGLSRCRKRFAARPRTWSLCLIPAGTFTMGSTENEVARVHDEAQHQVSISNAFYLASMK